MSYLCEVLVLVRQPDEAFDLAAQALALSRERHERFTEARLLFLLGMINSQGVARGEPADACHYNAALAVAGELRLLPIVAHCHLGLGKLYRQTGKRIE